MSRSGGVRQQACCVSMAPLPCGGVSAAVSWKGVSCHALMWTGVFPGQDNMFYWYRDLPYESGDLVLVCDGYVYAPGVAVTVPLSAMFGWWAGPILPPQGAVGC